MTTAIDLLAPLDVSIREYSEFAAAAEAYGFSGVAIADHHDYGRDAYIALALSASATSNIHLYTGVSNSRTRHPLVLAGLARSLSEVAPGRIDLILGPGDNSAIQTGTAPSTVAQMRESITTIRSLLDGEPLVFSEASPSLNLAIDPRPRIGMAASGPRMTELAGECADEALILAGVDDRIITNVRERLDLGATRRNRALDEMGLRWGVLVSVDDDIAVARERTRGYLFQWVNQGIFDVGMRALGMDPIRFESLESCSGELLERLSNAFFIIGRPAHCMEEIASVAKVSGAHRMFCMLAGTTAEGAVAMRQLSSFLDRLR